MLRLERVSAGYGRITIIMDLSLTVARGEMVALLGPNGAGKSTLVKTIAGVVPNRGGRIELEGIDLATLPPHRIVAAGVVLVPEGRRIFGPFSVIDNLRLGAMHSIVRRSALRKGSTTSSACSRRSRNGAGSAPARCRAANSRCWPSAAG